MKLSVVIPAYNEEATIQETVRRVQETPYEKEVIVVDDASTDHTPDILKQLDYPNLTVFTHEKNLGKGAAVKDAVIQGVSTKLRPVLMTTFTTIFGIMPLLLARGPGAEIWRPLATVVVGGLFTSTLVTLIILPLVYQRMKERDGSRSG